MGTEEPKTIGGGRDLAAAAETLRHVRLETRRFLELWAQELARVRKRACDDVQTEAALADFVKHDWSALYEGHELEERQ